MVFSDFCAVFVIRTPRNCGVKWHESDFDAQAYRKIILIIIDCYVSFLKFLLRDAPKCFIIPVSLGCRFSRTDAIFIKKY